MSETTHTVPESAEGGVTWAWLAAAAVTEAPDAIVVTDPDGIVRLWNNGAERVFGFSAAEIVGQSLDVIIPEKLRDRHWRGYRQTMLTGYTRYGDTLLSVPATHRDGRRLSVEFSVALLRDDADQIVGISAIMREISERREAEKALRAKLTELESRVGSA
ncbi:PAS domain-containing protein [Mycolicibacterium stellerae]|uniref:PAS domain-containing protein n=1 Tax=Mycolicibacterium stellerae TaxID=2358193 RepID=UPI000F0BB72F|nr:PAS domain S-box protein [Mycolicibacterium stellerae]